MRSYTDLEQSKKLAEFLPIESADMFYTLIDQGLYLEVKQGIEPSKDDIPAWSLAALLDVLPYPSLHKIFSDWRCDSYDKEGKTCTLGENADNPVDACYEMIIKLHEQKLL